ncbi:MAG: Mg-dependent DNAse [Berkelbacteria bacterium GW2011_GWB1_38_5]|uniref:Mg-dependent DNAse n=2 Tax=Candidatus Berkelbacteria TaxID=1618330 RepID=A0A0G0FGT5_9BACT|nr:MAG: Mg-dependent DNAse [Berkelbacteria bacterium GW2011_GWA1_36_9]KKQ73730.1 MAG: Mg-dependent DNAse [Berkelbacteria bacterium GW2011_GWB1_38_5]
MFIDTHAHLNFKDFDLDYIQVIERAKKAGVEKVIIPSSNLKTSLKAIEIAEEIDGVFTAVGLHPIHVKDEDFNETEFLRLAKNKKVVAIGEIGLDYYYDKSNLLSQKEVFAKSLRLAQVVSKPVIVHSREAGMDILPLLLAESPMPRGVMHCFQEDWQFAQTILEMGFYLSFTGLITFSKNQKTVEVIKKTPLERILIETDCPYMTPEPYRGKRNEPAYIVEVARKIAEIKKIPLEKVATQTSKNAIELFKLDK